MEQSRLGSSFVPQGNRRTVGPVEQRPSGSRGAGDVSRQLALLVFGGSVLLAGGAFVQSWRTGGAIPTSLIIVSVGGVLLSALLGVGALLADHIGKLKFQVEEALHAARQAGSDEARERHPRPSGGASVQK